MELLFGELFRELRLKQGLTLREYCRTFDKDPSYISKIERGKLSPPTREHEIEHLASTLGLKPDTDERDDFVTKAYLAGGRLPKAVMSDEEVIKKLPVVLRTMTGKKLTEQQMDAIIEIIKHN